MAAAPSRTTKRGVTVPRCAGTGCTPPVSLSAMPLSSLEALVDQIAQVDRQGLARRFVDQRPQTDAGVDHRHQDALVIAPELQGPQHPGVTSAAPEVQLPR